MSHHIITFNYEINNTLPLPIIVLLHFPCNNYNNVTFGSEIVALKNAQMPLKIHWMKRNITMKDKICNKKV